MHTHIQKNANIRKKENEKKKKKKKQKANDSPRKTETYHENRDERVDKTQRDLIGVEGVVERVGDKKTTQQPVVC